MGGGLGENGYMYMYGWLPSLFIWDYHYMLIDYTLIQNKSLKFFLKKAKGDGKKPGDEGAGDEI